MEGKRKREGERKLRKRMKGRDIKKIQKTYFEAIER